MLPRIVLFVVIAGSLAAGEPIPVDFVAPAGPAPAAAAPPGGDRVDFRFAPPRWQTSICLPDDPAKTLVDSEGRLLYEFGGGPHDGFQTRVSVRLEGEAARPSSQKLVDPRVPIVATEIRRGELSLDLEAFAAAPQESGLARPAARLEATPASVAPTVLYLLGVPTSLEMPGRPLSGLFADGFRQRVPMRTVPTYGQRPVTARPRGGAPLDQEMIDRLRSLGYVR